MFLSWLVLLIIDVAYIAIIIPNLYTKLGSNFIGKPIYLLSVYHWTHCCNYRACTSDLAILYTIMCVYLAEKFQVGQSTCMHAQCSSYTLQN